MKDFEYVSKSLPFSRKEVEGLAQRLAGLSDLRDEERELLVAVFYAARDRVTVPGEPPEETTKDLRKRILNAFVPDENGAFIPKETEALVGNENNAYIITYRIGTDPIIHPRNPPGS